MGQSGGKLGHVGGIWGEIKAFQIIWVEIGVFGGQFEAFGVN